MAQALLWLGAAQLCGGAAQAQAVLAARVNGAGITLDLLDRQFEELLRDRRLNIVRMNNPARAKSIKREALDNLIRIELLWQEARAAGLVASDAEVEQAIAEARGRFRDNEAFLRRVEQSGFDEAGYRDHTRKLLSGDRYAQRIVDRDVHLTEQDAREFYEANPRLFRREEQVKARHILVAVPSGAPAEKRADARRRIEQLRARALAGESFDALARNHSDDVTRQWGGELDPFSRGQKPRAFEDAAFGLLPGAVSGVVETAAGLHIIRLEQRIAAASVSLADASERILAHLLRVRGKEAIDREVDQLRALGKVDLLSPL